MAYLGDKLTDEEMAKIENRLESIYKQVSDELDQKAKEYFLTFAERYKKEYAAYKEGKYTDLEFKSWYLAQVGRGKRWSKLKADAAQKMTETNKIAAAYVNGKTPGIYALNANFTAFEIESESGIAFNLVNEDTVRELALNNNHSEFKTLSVNPKRDYAWNYDKIQNNLLAGILQGKSIDKIADTFYQVMQNNKSAAVRNARTAVTSAQNAGRQNTFNRAEEMGITIQKEWISTHDGRVRDSHAALDGVRVNNDRPFPNGLRYPGDPSGAPAEVYNCRCTMRSIIPKYNEVKRTENTSASYAAWVLQKTASSGKIKDENKAFVVKDALASGIISKKINKDKQRKHIIGDNKYISGRSYLYCDLSDTQKIVDEFCGTGEAIFDNKGKWTRKERIKCDFPVGVYISLDKIKKEVKSIVIAYSKNGCHIYPGKEDK